jgi:hypothetical protein
VSASVTRSTPAATAWSTKPATSSDVTSSPGNGEPKQHDTTASSTAPGAASRITSTSARAWSIVRRVFFSL